MQSKWETWLLAMNRARKGGVVLGGATRGRAWNQLMTISGDWSAASFRGEVRASPDAVGAALAAFAFTTPTYDSGSDKTSVTISLAAGAGANSTGVLPADNDGDGEEQFLFDILATPSAGTEDVLIAGILPVAGRITA